MFFYSAIENDPAVVHFTTMNKPWNLLYHFLYRDEYWKYKKMSPWKYSLPKNISILNILKYLKMKLFINHS